MIIAHPMLIDMGTEIGHFKLYFYFWSWIIPRAIWEGSKLATNNIIIMSQSDSNICHFTLYMPYTEDIENFQKHIGRDQKQE